MTHVQRWLKKMGPSAASPGRTGSMCFAPVLGYRIAGRCRRRNPRCLWGTDGPGAVTQGTEVLWLVRVGAMAQAGLADPDPCDSHRLSDPAMGEVGLAWR